MWSWFTSILLGSLSGIGQVVTKVLEHIREQQLKAEGEAKAKNEIKAKEAEVAIKQAEIVAQGESREETIKKMEDGKF